MKFSEIIKNIFKGIWNVIKAIIGALHNYMKSTWEQWDKEADIKTEKRMKARKPSLKDKLAGKSQPAINLDDYDEFNFKRISKDEKKKK